MNKSNNKKIKKTLNLDNITPAYTYDPSEETVKKGFTRVKQDNIDFKWVFKKEGGNNNE
jgi:intergrase/recombinase